MLVESEFNQSKTHENIANLCCALQNAAVEVQGEAHGVEARRLAGDSLEVAHEAVAEAVAAAMVVAFLVEADSVEVAAGHLGDAVVFQEVGVAGEDFSACITIQFDCRYPKDLPGPDAIRRNPATMDTTNKGNIPR